MNMKEYKLNIDPRILELLGPSLYTNIYYIIAELIANAYDADAHNVYIIDNGTNITVEDDGNGMSYVGGEIGKYLNVARISRNSESDAETKLGRKKMGRKGVGKLAALSVSENVLVKTITNDEKSGLISQLAELTYYFLGKNRNYASRVFNTIIMLAEDEMNHQKFNAVYIKNHNDAEYEFIPNMVPKLRGVDYWIRENKGNEYQNKRSEIIQEYLYDGKGGDLSEFDISNYDIDLLCNIACCGLDTEDEEFAIVISSIVQCMIEIWHKNCKEMRAHEIIDTFQEHKVSSYFQRELNIIGRNPEAVYDILFKGTDFSKFTRDTLDFYEDVLSGFLVSYVDGFREKGKRDDIEKKIRILETYVNSIPEDYVRNILEKRLFLCKGRYSRWDVNKVKAEYSYKDKCFLNVQIEKYGSNHLNDVLYTVYLLNISELLPEILTSISSCFTKAIRNSKEQFAKEIIDSQVIVDTIILKSFIFYSDEIKKDEKLINAYEDILLALTEIRNEKAAVLLDEFRIH